MTQHTSNNSLSMISCIEGTKGTANIEMAGHSVVYSASISGHTC